MIMRRYVKRAAVVLLVFLLGALVVPYSVEAASVKLNKTRATIYVGNTVSLKLVNASKVSWKSGNGKIASVNAKGVVTGLKSGTAKITAVSGSKKYTATITVKPQKLNKTSLVLFKGGTYKLDFPKLSTNIKASWKSSKASIAKVKENGLVTAKSNGEAVISATIKNETYKCTVTVVDALSREDFSYGIPDSEGFRNYIDYTAVKGKDFFCYYKEVGSAGLNRGIMPEVAGVADVMAAYGEVKVVKVNPRLDRFCERFAEGNIPQTAAIYEYTEEKITYYKKFYFDKDKKLAFVIWYQ